ncbi:Nicotinate phosphoribosyltransferase [Smittium mucronatum]|uniref:Nicotinate phosphoribosyltransferase n=1 Tax=Smittium mucronatum TaxID=133383 RepID=A0A1R0H3T7_9FUNG|nr:Nicotinate phosphoribosyltransferase [Smittium mucronatum]
MTGNVGEGIQSILDQDLYKFCMQMAVMEHYPEVMVNYSFINRNPEMKFNYRAFEWLVIKIDELTELRLREEEYEYLKSECPYLSTDYLDYLRNFRYFPKDQVQSKFVVEEKTETLETRSIYSINPTNIRKSESQVNPDTMGHIDITIKGYWTQVILYEVQILSLISEAYFKFVDLDWDMTCQADKIREKATQLLENGCKFSEFGTRRRRSYNVQDLIVKELGDTYKAYLKKHPEHDENKGQVSGTSNVYLAKKYGLSPSGTVGHEWTMGIAALENTFLTGNKLALYKWHASFRGELGIGLTDTFGIKSFFENFDYFLSSIYSGIRHDSGNPDHLIDLAVNHYHDMGIDYSKKRIVFSDSLNVTRAISLNDTCRKRGIGCAFGIGTFFTNDFHMKSNPSQNSPALNIVIKLVECGGVGCVKLSDDPGKHTGRRSDINRALIELGLK